MKRRPRKLLKFGLLILLGAIVNVAVAWGLSLWMHVECAEVSDEQVEDLLMRCFGGSLTSIATEDWAPPRGGEGYSVGLRREFAIAYGKDMGGNSHFYSSMEHWCGLPLEALHGGHLHFDNSIWGNKALLPSERFARQIGTSYGLFVPLRPLWPGFAINTVFYAAVLWLLFAAPLALQRRKRIKRGLCPTCAYPVGASDVCTECGKQFQRTRVDLA